MTTALVTGAAGLLGRATVDALADSGAEVHGVVRAAVQGHRDDVTFHELDLTRPIERSTLPGRIDTVFHLAQAREFRDFPGAAPSVFAINVATTAALLDYAHHAGATSFVYASSGGVYHGRPEPITEDSPILPPAELGYYLATKVSSESLVQSYGGEFSTAALRYFFIYGPGQQRSMLIPRLFDRVRNGEALSLQGDNGMRINPVHATDAAAATIAASAIVGRSTVNVAGPQTVSLREIGELFARELGRDPLFDQSSGTATDLIGSIERMSATLVAPTRTLADSLDDIRD